MRLSTCRMDLMPQYRELFSPIQQSMPRERNSRSSKRNLPFRLPSIPLFVHIHHV